MSCNRRARPVVRRPFRPRGACRGGGTRPRRRGRSSRRERLLRVGVALRDQLLRLQGRPGDAALAGEALADMGVDPLAQLIARGQHPGARAFFRREFEPARGDRAGDIVRVNFGHVGAEPVERPADLARKARLDGGLQVGIALAQDLVHDRGLHARLLKLGEGLADRAGLRQDQTLDARRPEAFHR